MKNQRLDFIDNIRSLLICQVVLVHAAVTYGGEGGWYYQEPTQNLATVMVLTLFNALSQSFFMSLLFFFSGFFSLLSVQKKSSFQYVGERLKRLGIPLFIFYVGIGPLSIWLAGKLDSEFEFQYQNSIHAGPMWFAQTLLIFSGLFLIIRSFSKFKIKPVANLPFSWVQVAILILVLSVLTFLARFYWPMGAGVAGMQLGSFGHYTLLFALGVFATQINWQNWLLEIPSKTLSALVAIGVLLLPVGLALGFSSDTEFTPFLGGLSKQAIFYACWESAMCVLLSMLMVKVVFLKNRRSSKVWQVMGRSNYGVYFIHTPVLILVSIFLQPIALFALGKFVIASFLTLIISFPLAWGLTRIPVVRSIL